MFGKVANFKINMQKATDFLSNNNNQLEDIMEQKTLFAAKQNKTFFF